MKVKELRDSLRPVQFAVRGAIVPGEEIVVFDGKRVYAACGNRVGIAPFKTAFKCCVDGTRLFSIISTLPSDVDVTLSFADNALQLRSATTTAALVHYGSDKIGDAANRIKGAMSGVTAKSYKAVPAEFLSALDMCSFAAYDSGYGMYTLDAVYVGGLDCIATDSYRCAWYTLSKRVPVSAPCLIPVSVIKDLCNLKLNADKVSVVKGRSTMFLRLGSSSTVVGFVLLGIGDCMFPDPADLLSVFSDSGGDVVTVKLPDISDMFRRVETVIDENVEIYRNVRVTFSKVGVHVRAEKDGVGWVEDSTNIDGLVDGEFVINVSPGFIKAAFGKADTFYYTKGSGRIIFKSGDGNFKYLVPLHVDADE